MRSIAGTDATHPEESRHHQPRFRIPHDLPTTISRHVIPVTQPADVLSEFRSRRERNFHLLIRRFINQIRYGCGNPACATPTCLTYQRRTTKAPLRRLTPLSARTLACYLASEPSPEASLCPYCPQVYPELESLPAVKRPRRRKSHNVTFEPSDKVKNAVATKSIEDDHTQTSAQSRSRPGVLVSSKRESSSLRDSRERLRDQRTDGRPEEACFSSQTETRAPRDPRSFTQSLFETLPLRMLGWLPFQQAGDKNSASRRSPYQHASEDDEHLSMETSEDLGSVRGHQLKQRSPSPTLPKLSRQIISPASVKGPESDLKWLPNGDAQTVWNFDSILGLRHPNGSSDLRKDHRGSTESVKTSLTSVSLPEHTKTSPEKISSPFLPADWHHSTGKDAMSKKEERRERIHGHDSPAQDDGYQSDADDQAVPSHLVKGDTDPIAVAYTLRRISGQTFTALRLMQARLEKQCLGYHLTDQRRWPDGPKPYDHLALRFSDWNAFVKQCCFYLLKDPFRLARAFEWDAGPQQIIDTAERPWPTSILPINGFEIFGALYRLRPSEEILHFLSNSLDHVFLSRLELLRSVSSRPIHDQGQRRRSSGRQSVDRNASGLSNSQAAFICAVMLHALNRLTVIKHRCSYPDHADLCWRAFCRVRSSGRILPADVITELDGTAAPNCYSRHLKCLIDVFDDESALELVSKLATAISNRVTFSMVSNARVKQESSKRCQTVLQVLVRHLQDFTSQGIQLSKGLRPLPLSSTTLEWLRTIILRDWDGQPIVRRAGAVGGALQTLAAMYENRAKLSLDADTFYTPFFAERLDSMEMPVEWLSYRPDNRSFHLLSYPFLFPPSALVTYFRALNFATMSKSFETALITARHVSQFACSEYIAVANDVELLNTMRPAMATYLVLNVRRDNVVTDAIDQLWRRQKRELMRPLKVRMGMDEGEEGVDHGGVQQEFFRCLFAEALDPAYGMFAIDPGTRMTWFQPRSLEPLYKFEMLGVLFSIAVYNSITLPVTFPVALYRKLLDLNVKELDHIRDGWPDLAKGLQALLDWSDGDVGDVLMRTYEFSFYAFGEHIQVDMQRYSPDGPWPALSPQNELDNGTTRNEPQPEYEADDARNDGPLVSSLRDGATRHADALPSPSTSSKPASEASLVTNSNREEFVKDYIFWLTDKSIRPQYEAFVRGFYTCLDRSALSIFNPEALRCVVEGSQNVDVHELEAITKYEDGFTPDAPAVRNFWDVVRAFSDEEKRGLLEFVTASDRVPVNGIGSIVFIIQRSGFDDARLPTSMTCFGRLLLPQYSTKEIMQEKLTKAIENAKGFGVA